MTRSGISHRFTGFAFFLIAVGFLVWFGARHLETMPALDWRSSKVLGALGMGSTIYLLGLAIMAHSWRVLLHGFGETPTGVRVEIIDLSTQAAKYIPGNVAHLVGRVALARAAGHSVTLSTVAVLVQHVLAGYAALLLAGLGILVTPSAYGAIAGYLPPRSVLIAVLAAGAVLPFVMGHLTRAVGARLPRRLREIGYHLDHLRRRDVAWCLFLMAVFFGLGGLALIQASQAVIVDSPSFIPAVVVFAAAWVAGTSTPGAPGGLGVREIVLSLGLTPMIGGGPALSVALVTRLITVAADATASGIGLIGLRRTGLDSRKAGDPH